MQGRQTEYRINLLLPYFLNSGTLLIFVHFVDAIIGLAAPAIAAGLEAVGAAVPILGAGGLTAAAAVAGSGAVGSTAVAASFGGILLGCIFVNILMTVVFCCNIALF